MIPKVRWEVDEYLSIETSRCEKRFKPNNNILNNKLSPSMLFFILFQILPKLFPSIQSLKW